jgi:hypothetical protein
VGSKILDTIHTNFENVRVVALYNISHLKPYTVAYTFICPSLPPFIIPSLKRMNTIIANIRFHGDFAKLVVVLREAQAPSKA